MFFRKKPIEGIQYTGDNLAAINSFISGLTNKGAINIGDIQSGQYVIKGLSASYFIVPENIFEEIYEEDV